MRSKPVQPVLPPRLSRATLDSALGAPETAVSGLTTWADFQVVCGCAAEAGRKVRHRWVRSPDGAIPPLVAWTLS
jgi:hypothetical protein